MRACVLQVDTLVSIHVAASDDIIGALFGGPGRVAVLRALADADSPLTGRQIARLTGVSHSGANRALEHLASAGVVRRTAVGPALVNELDRDSDVVAHILLPALEAEERIASVRAAESGGVPREVVLRLVEGFDPVRIILFGSRARGEADEGSDFDLLVVLPEVADRHAATVAMLIALGGLAVPVDIVAAAVADTAPGAAAPGGVVERALAEGVTVYERVA